MYTQIVRHGEGALHYYVYTHATLNLTNFIKKKSHTNYIVVKIPF